MRRSAVALCTDPAIPGRCLDDPDDRLMQVYYAAVQYPDRFIQNLRSIPAPDPEEMLARDGRLRELLDGSVTALAENKRDIARN